MNSQEKTCDFEIEIHQRKTGKLMGIQEKQRQGGDYNGKDRKQQNSDFTMERA